MSFDYFLGIDPGKTGGLVLLAGNGDFIMETTVMGTISEVINWLRLHPITKTMTYIEKAQAMPKNGAVSMFNYGCGYGELLGALAALNMPHTAVPPATWSKVMHQGISRSLPPKARSLAAFKRLFPGVDLKATDKCKKQHEGLVDAILLAEYGRLRHNGDIS